MNYYRILTFSLLSVTIACSHRMDKLPLTHSSPFNELEIQVDGYLAEVYSNQTFELNFLSDDSIVGDSLTRVLQQMLSEVNQFRITGDDSLFIEVQRKWSLFNENYISPYGIVKKHLKINTFWNETELDYSNTHLWLQLNMLLYKATGLMKYGEVVEHAIYNNPWGQIISEKELKSVYYTHNFDDIYVNIFGMSALSFTHTTGGKIRMIQDTNYPYSGEILFRFECDDKRLVNLYVKIPEWAEYATVSHGNVKYVATAGEYCLVSRKWKTGDILRVNLGATPQVKSIAIDGKEGLVFILGPLILVPKFPDGKNEFDNLTFNGTDPHNFLRLVSLGGQPPVFIFEGIDRHPVIYRDFFSDVLNEFDYHHDMIFWEPQL